MIAARYIVKRTYRILEVKGRAKHGRIHMLARRCHYYQQRWSKNVVMATQSIIRTYLKIEVDVKDKDKQVCADAVMLTLGA